MTKNTTKTNPLFPVFIKLAQLNLSIIGGGMVALEKLNTVLRNSPQANIVLIAPEIEQAIYESAAKCSHIEIKQRLFVPEDLNGQQLLIVATNDKALNNFIRDEAKKRNILVNFADKPALCDFYLGSVVTKGDLKMAISTNGKSPVLAKRLREYFDECLPKNMDDALDHLSLLRKTIQADLATKTALLNELTKLLLTKEPFSNWN